MCIKVLAKGLMKEYQIDYETAKKIYQQRAKRKFDTPSAFKREKILLRGKGNGKNNSKRKETISIS